MIETLPRARLYFSVFISGGSALLYQVVWHKYLAILLGSHARATAVVLSVFLGGLGAGYGYFGGAASLWRGRLLRSFAFIEFALGAYALLFPLFFRAAFALSPILDSVFGINSLLTDLLLASALVGPPAFLMGGSLPLLTQGLSEDLESASTVHARVYGFNTVGAALGALSAGYVFVPFLGLPESIRLGALLNFAAGLIAFAVAKREQEADSGPRDRRIPFFSGLQGLTENQRVLLLVGLLSGFYVLTVETLLIRLTGLSAGSSAYHFSLIVSIFVLGLGLAPLLARGIASFRYVHLFWNQVAVTVLLLLVYASGDLWPYAVHLLRIPFRDEVGAYFLFQMLLGGGLFAFLILPVGACGLTLPLCFHLFKDDPKTLGHRTGLLYAANTVGSVLGGFLGGYSLLFIADMETMFKLVVASAAATAFAAGWMNLRAQGPRPRILLTGIGLTVLTFVASLFIPPFKKDRFIQAFLYASPLPVSYKGPSAFEKHMKQHITHIYYEDGPNTSVGVAVTRKDGRETERAIIVNGKSDGNTAGDRFTTMMLGHLPALLAPRPSRVCVIGFGTGITAGVLAGYEEVRTVDIVEISHVVGWIAHMFDAYNSAVTKNPKAAFHIMDAFRFLRSTPQRYDLIVSEPSNPWVQGVENLYSREFYRIARDRLEKEGLFVQWIHTYSFTDELFRTVLATLNDTFAHVTVFRLRSGDRVLLAHARPFGLEDLRRASARFTGSPVVTRSLAFAGITDLTALLSLEEVTPSLSRALGEGAPLQTLDHPVLSHRAAVALFADEAAHVDRMRRLHPRYYEYTHQSLAGLYARAVPDTLARSDARRRTFCGHVTSKTTELCQEEILMTAASGKGLLLKDERSFVDSTALAAAELFGRPTPPPNDPRRLLEIDEMLRLFIHRYSPAARFPAGPLQDRITACIQGPAEPAVLKGECLLRNMILARMLGVSDVEHLKKAGEYREWVKGTEAALIYRELADNPSESQLMKHLHDTFSARVRPPAP